VGCVSSLEVCVCVRERKREKGKKGKRHAIDVRDRNTQILDMWWGLVGGVYICLIYINIRTVVVDVYTYVHMSRT